MAKRFFKKEVQKLYLGEGQEFRGEGILALTKVLMKLSIGSRP
jgi:indolepyruvate ferredoxin oxidoreductase alpha subunit